MSLLLCRFFLIIGIVVFGVSSLEARVGKQHVYDALRLGSGDTSTPSLHQDAASVQQASTGLDERARQLYGSVLLGLFAHETGLVYNLRFFGNYTPGYSTPKTDEARDITAKIRDTLAGNEAGGDITLPNSRVLRAYKNIEAGVGIPMVDAAMDIQLAQGNLEWKRDYARDSSKDPHWNLVKIFFPSANGTFNIGGNFQDNLSYMLNGMTPENRFEVLARIMVHIAEKSSSVAERGSLADDMIKKLKSSHRKKIKNAKNKGKETLFDVLTKALDAAIEAENKPGSFYPRGTVEQIFNAFVVECLNTQEDLEQYVKAVVDVVPADQIAGLVGGSQAKALIKTFMVYYEDIRRQPTPYTFGVPMISNGTATSPNGRSSYADCVETTVRQFFNFALYNFTEGSFKVPGVMLENEALREFYSRQTKDRANDGSTAMRTRWSHVVSDMNRKTVPRVPVVDADFSSAATATSAGLVHDKAISRTFGDSEFDEIVYVKGNYELETGHLNFLRVVARVMGIPLSEIKKANGTPLGSVPQQKEKAIAYIKEAYVAVLETLNPDYDYEVAGDLSWRAFRRDFMGDLTFTYQFKGDSQGFRFDLEMSDGHGEISSLEPLIKEAARAGATLSLGSIGELTHAGLLAYNLSTFKHESGGVDLPSLYRVFPQPLTDNNGYIEALKQFLLSVPSEGYAQIVRNLASEINLDDRHVRERFGSEMTATYMASVKGSPQERVMRSYIPALQIYSQEHADQILPILDQFSNLQDLYIDGVSTSAITIKAPGLKRLEVLGAGIGQINGLYHSPNLKTVRLLNNPNMLGKVISLHPAASQESFIYDRGVTFGKLDHTGYLVENPDREVRFLRMLDLPAGEDPFVPWRIAAVTHFLSRKKEEIDKRVHAGVPIEETLESLKSEYEAKSYISINDYLSGKTGIVVGTKDEIKNNKAELKPRVEINPAQQVLISLPVKGASGEYAARLSRDDLPSSLQQLAVVTQAAGPIKIGDDFLYGCSGLTSLDLSGLSNVTKIGKKFLFRCNGLTSLDLSGLSNVTKIGKKFLSACPNLRKLDLSPLSKVTEIEEDFLFMCIRLTDLDLSGLSNVTKIGGGFLSRCGKLTDLDLSPLSNVTRIGDNSLSDCRGLTSIHCGEAQIGGKIKPPSLRNIPNGCEVYLNLAGAAFEEEKAAWLGLNPNLNVLQQSLADTDASATAAP